MLVITIKAFRFFTGRLKLFPSESGYAYIKATVSDRALRVVWFTEGFAFSPA